MDFSEEELERYSRQILLPEFGLEAQAKLKKSKVLIVGCGGLGSPVALYLTAAGVGNIGLIDADTVSKSNLQRQILFNENEVGEKKVSVAADKLKSLNNHVNFELYDHPLNSDNALAIFQKYDLIIDGSDNFPTRYLVNDACILTGKSFVSGAIYRFEGQIAVFNYNNGPTYRDLFPEPPAPEMAPNCSTAGVLGMMAGVIGSLQALEAIKVLTGIGEVLSDKILIVDALSLSFRKIGIQKNEDLVITELIDYDQFCAAPEIETWDFEMYLSRKAEIVQVIDVREPEEYQKKNIGGVLIPLSDIENEFAKISKTGKVLIHCQSGIRSQKAIKLLKDRFGYTNLINLEGGMNATY